MSEPTLSFEVPLRLVSMANARMHHMAKSRIVKSQREATHWHMTAALTTAGYRPGNKLADCLGPDGLRFLPRHVRIRRYGPGVLDGDNLQSACKAARDAVAVLLGIDDGDPRVTWMYEQTRRKTWGACVELWA